MSNDIPEAVVHAIGWTWAKACLMLDHDRDPREYCLLSLLDRYREDCALREELERAAATPEVQRAVKALLNCQERMHGRQAEVVVPRGNLRAVKEDGA